MTNSMLTTAFLKSTDSKIKNQILQNIASHYRVSIQEAYEEITEKDAESLMDYITGNIRPAISILLQKFIKQ